MFRAFAVAAAAFVLAAPAAQAANLLVNGGFEADDVSAAPYYLRGIPTGWSAVPGLDVVDVIHDTYTQGPPVLLNPAEGDQFVDMNGAQLIGGIRQDVGGLTPGAVYTLRLLAGQWAANGAGAVRYSLIDPATNAEIAGEVFDVTGQGWTQRSLSGAANSSGALRIQLQTAYTSQAGPGVDNVRLSAGVPEPGAWAMMILGFGGAGAILRRRRTSVT